MSQRASRLTIIVNSITMLLFAVLFVSQPASAATYYPDYTLSTTQTDKNIELALTLAAVGLLLIAIDSLLFLAHFLWSKRPSAKRARRQTWSQERF